MSSKHSGDNSNEPKSKSKPKSKPPQNPSPNPSSAAPQNPNPKSPKSMTAAAASPGVPKPSKSKTSAGDERMAILRGAVEFKKRTGAAPTGSTSVAFFETLKGLIDGNLTASKVFNKLRHFREKLSQSPKKDDDAYRLSVELWPDKKESKDSKKKKDKGSTEKGKNVVGDHGGEKAKNTELDSESEEEEDNAKSDKKKEIKETRKRKDKKDNKEKDNYVMEPRGGEKAKNTEIDSESEEEEENAKLDKKKVIKEMNKRKDKKDNYVFEPRRGEKAEKTELDSESEEEEAEVGGQVEENVKLDKKKEIKELKEKKDERDNKGKNNYVIEPRGPDRAKRMELDSESEEEEEESDKQVEENKDEEEEDKEEDDRVAKKAKVVENGREGELGIESLDYVKQAVTEYWKANGLSSATLEEGLKRVDPVKARDLEEKWKRHLNDEMRLLLDWSKTSRDVLVNLHGVHKDTKI